MHMKKVYVVLMLFALLISAFSIESHVGNAETFKTNSLKDDLNTGLVAHWSFDEGSGNILEDLSGHGNNGKIYNATWVKGVKGAALSFNGVNSFVDCGNNSSLNISGAITIAAWMHPMGNYGWRYMRPIYINPVTPESNYQVKIVLNSTNFDYTHAKRDGGDLRFYQTDGTKLNYWIEEWNPNGISIIWVKVERKNTNKIYMCYGNPSATSESNGTATFDFFDDFNKYNPGTEINGQGGWITKRIGGSGDASIEVKDSNKYLHLSSTDKATSVVHPVNTNNSGYAISIKEFANECNQSISLIFSDGEITSDGEALNGYEAVWWGWDGTYTKIRMWSNGETTDLATIEDSDKNYVNHTLEFTWYKSQLSAYTDGKLKLNANDTTYTSRTYIQLKEWNGSSRYVDWVMVRKYVSPEPKANVGQETVMGIFKSGSYGVGENSTEAFASINNNIIYAKIAHGWNYIVMTYDGSYQKLFLNGTLIASKPLKTTMNTNQNDLLIGFLFNGLIDEVRIYNRSLNASEIKELYYLVVPKAPQNLNAEKNRISVNLTWAPPENYKEVAIDEYEIYRSDDGKNYKIIGTSQNTSYCDKYVEEGKKYYYYIAAVSISGIEGNISNTIVVDLIFSPTAPTDLKAIAGNRYVNLTWSPPLDNGGSSIISYRIYRNTTPIANVSATRTWYNDTSVINGHNYTYYVTAVNSVGESVRSNKVNATPKTVPSAPQNLNAIAGNRFVNLTWSAPSDDGGAPITGYRIYRNGTLIANVSANQLWYNDTSVINGHNYTYYVTAVNSVGESQKSNAVTAKPTSPPSGGAGFLNNLFGSSSWIWLIIALAAAVIIIVVIVFMKRKAKT
ncbi:MAG: DUF2341 domain-containing protein [Euryarchaeota archaeon]|nr:DUF2341 domain-containing protein [Euryarchaeota archaeon]